MENPKKKAEIDDLCSVGEEFNPAYVNTVRI
jgi:hypothetical protein